MSNNLYFYTEERYQHQLISDKEKVFLLGSYIGYGNFGDILQLKGALEFHHKETGLEPVIICSIDSISSPNFLDRLRSWFNGVTFIFFSDKLIEFEKSLLTQKFKVAGVNHLHLYGGGFLNKMWGEFKLNIIEHLFKKFEFKNYVISGQQLDIDIAEIFKSHVEKFKPSLIGVRDYGSLESFKKLGLDIKFSFDDAYEMINQLANEIEVEDSNELLIHLNLSSYTGNDDSINKLKHALEYLEKQEFDSFKVLQMYEDRRHTVKDSLDSIIQLEDYFPFTNYQVINMARYALALNSKVYNTMSPIKLSNKLCVTSSYHTTMLMNILQIPCYLFAFNDFYEQKKNALSGNYTLEEFIKTPTLFNYNKQFAERKIWLEELKACFKENRSEIKTIRVDENSESESYKMFLYKTDGIKSLYESEIEWQKEQTDLWWKKSQDLEWKVAEKEEELEWQQSQTTEWWEKTVTLQGQLEELEHQREELLKQIQELNNINSNLTFEKEKLSEDIISLQAEIEHLGSFIYYIKSKFKK